MNTYFRFEQPWLLLLAALLPLFWFVGRRFQRPPVVRFAAARIFERATTFRRSWRKAVQNAPSSESPTSQPSTSRAPTGSGSRSPTARTSTRWIPTRSTAGTTSWSCSSPTRRQSWIPR